MEQTIWKITIGKYEYEGTMDIKSTDEGFFGKMELESLDGEGRTIEWISAEMFDADHCIADALDNGFKFA